MAEASPSRRYLVRLAQAEDMAAIAHIYGHHVINGLGSFEETAPDAAEMSARWQTLRAAGYPYLVAADSATGQLAGYAYGSAFRPRPAYRHCLEDSVYVAPAHQGKGLGTSLLRALIHAAEAGGYRQMVAMIGDRDNHASIGLHAAQGFAHGGLMKAVGYKHGRWVDVVIMQRVLGPGATEAP